MILALLCLAQSAPLTEAERAAYATPPAARPLPSRRALTLAIVPLEFSDRAADPTLDLSKTLLAGVAEYYRSASGGVFGVAGRVWPAVKAPVARAAATRADVEGALREFLRREGPGVRATADAVALVASGPLAPRGSALWPRRDAVDVDGKPLDYVLLAEDGSPKGVAIAAHEFMHLLGFEDKYDDAKSQVGADCILGTGFDPARLPPPCADCRLKLMWSAAGEIDPTKASLVVLPRQSGIVLRIRLTPDGAESLLLEMRERLLVWHVGGGARIERLGAFPTASSDRLTPFSEPGFRARSVGARDVWITDVRVEDGRAWFRVGPSAPLTPQEESRRLKVGKRLGD